jgi:DNA-binding NarL/FixJ family response regulator
MAVTTDKQIVDRLDQILKVLALQVATDQSLTERARLLKLAGMDNHTIAEVLNTSDATVRTLTSNLRRRDTRLKRTPRR